MSFTFGGGSGEAAGDGGLNNADGSTGNTYEALFETDATDTIFRGEKGMAAANDNRLMHKLHELR